MKTMVDSDRPPRLLALKNDNKERRMKGKLIPSGLEKDVCSIK